MNKEIVFVGRMQNKTREYIHNLEREIKLLEQENKELKRNCNIGNENLDFYRQQYKELHNKIGVSIGILKTWKDFCEVKRKYCIEKDKEHWTYCIEKIECLEEALKDGDIDE